MQLSRYSDYAYRVLLYTAINKKRCTLAEIGRFYSISVEHLRKVVHKLGQLNYLRTYKGKFGGMELNIAPEDIILGDIYREFEAQKGQLIDCSKLNCVLTPGCKLKKVMLESEQAFITHLDQFTLADLLDKRTSQVLDVANL